MIGQTGTKRKKKLIESVFNINTKIDFFFSFWSFYCFFLFLQEHITVAIFENFYVEIQVFIFDRFLLEVSSFSPNTLYFIDNS